MVGGERVEEGGVRSGRAGARCRAGERPADPGHRVLLRRDRGGHRPRPRAAGQRGRLQRRAARPVRRGGAGGGQPGPPGGDGADPAAGLRDRRRRPERARRHRRHRRPRADGRPGRRSGRGQGAGVRAGQAALRGQPPGRPRGRRPAGARAAAGALRRPAGLRRTHVAAGRRRDHRTGSPSWARPSTTRPARRTTRWPGCWGCPIRAGRRSTGRRPGDPRYVELPARPDRPQGPGAAPVRLLLLRAEDRGGPVGRDRAAGRPDRCRCPTWPPASRRRSATCSAPRRWTPARRPGRIPADRRWRGRQPPAAGAAGRAGRGAGHRAAYAAARPVHRQRRHDRGPRRGDRHRRRPAVGAWTSGPTRRCRSTTVLV